MKRWTFIFLFLLTTVLIIYYIKHMQNDKPVWSFEKTTKFSIEKVEEILFAMHTGEYKLENFPFILKNRTQCFVTKESELFIITYKDGHKEFVTIDATNHKLTYQGEWWYKGVYTLQRNNNQTIITLDIYNVANKFRWVASLMILPEKKKHKADFEQLINNLEKAGIK